MSDIKTKKELTSMLKALGELNDETKKGIVCQLIGHSNIITTCFGYIHCSRCEAQIGDTLAGCYDNPKSVIVGHNCETCKENYKKLTWRDKYLCPDPFKAEVVIE